MEIYNEILKLKQMLEEANIPFEFEVDFVTRIIINKHGRRLCDAIEGFGSYGEEEDLIEIMGALTTEEVEEDSVLGYLTAEEVFKRFKYCYEKNTSIYKEVGK